MNPKYLIYFALLVLVLNDHPILYEISTRPWLYELSKKYGRSITKLVDIPTQEFDQLQKSGVEIVWMMGVWKLGNYGLEFDRKQDYSSVLPGWTKDDVIGSPYAITEYTCNPDIGTDDDLIWLRKQFNNRGMKLMLDFVPNHSAVDAPTASSNKKLYMRAPPGTSNPNRYTSEGLAYGKDPWFDPWRDVLQWNYWESETRTFMKNNLLTVLKFADGARCDMAHLILNDVFSGTWKDELAAWSYSKPSTEFWEYAFKEVKARYPNAILLAEVYDDWQIEKLYQLGFTYCYDKLLLDKLEKTAYDVNDYIHYKGESFFGHVAHFVENHDENRAVFNMQGNIEKAKAAGTIAATLGGMIFFNHGQWSGLRNKLDVHLRRGANESPDSGTVKYYEKLMQIIVDPAFKGPNYYFVWNMSGDRKNDFIAYIREKDKGHYLVVVNYNQYYGCAEVPIHNISGSGNRKIKEMISGVEYTRNADTMRGIGLTVCLQGYQAQIFKYSY